MTDVTEDRDQAGAELSAADEQLLRELTERARAGGLKLTGEGGLLGQLTKMVVEGALEGELDDHLGYGKHDPAGRDGGNSRNGHRAKTVLTEAGPAEISVPRDRESSFDPKIVAKRQRRLTGRGSPAGRSPRTWPRSTAPRSPSRRSRLLPTGSWKAWRNGRAGHWTPCTR
jgi:putative transposase